MNKLERKQLIFEVQKVEAKYGSVANVPETDTESMSVIRELTKKSMDQPTIYKLTTLEYTLIRRYMREKMKMKDLCEQVGHSNSWVRPRIVAIETGRIEIA